MNGEARYFLDTNALIALGNGNERLQRMLETADYIGTSIICKIEYLTGISQNAVDVALFLSLLSQIDVVDLTNADLALTNETVRIRQTNKHIKLPDAIVMASANLRQAILLTNDKQVLGSDLAIVRAY